MKVQSISIDVRDQVSSLQIHGFGDSSEVAYAATVYLRIETIKGISTQLIMSKPRVAPLTKPTIPRLELLAALILARLVQRIREALQPIAQIEVFCWTDSMTTLHWIKGVNKEYKQFVQNRVKEIRQLIPSESWNHCPGYENPADLPPRGMSAEALQESEIWWHGPPWLLEGKDKWPNPAMALNCHVTTTMRCVPAINRTVSSFILLDSLWKAESQVCPVYWTLTN